MKSIKVLAIDGGGIRGIIPALILSEFEKRIGRPLYECFDLIAGTSTGGIIALGIGTRCKNGGPYAPSDLAQLYAQYGPAIFQKHFWTRVTQLLRPKYSPAPLESTLKHYFKNVELESALTPLLISSYDLQQQIPFFFKSHKIASDASFNWQVRDVARATSAAPTFFPPLRLTDGLNEYALVDGGVFVNNPSMAAYAEARRLYPKAERIVLVSVGTGDRQDHISYTSAKKWGLLGWARQIIPVLMDSVSEAVDYELDSLPGCKYYRLQISPLEMASSEMDDASQTNILDLQTVAENYIASSSKRLSEIFLELQEGRGSDVPGIGYKSEPTKLRST